MIVKRRMSQEAQLQTILILENASVSDSKLKVIQHQNGDLLKIVDYQENYMKLQKDVERVL